MLQVSGSFFFSAEPAFKKFHGKDEIIQAVQVLLPQFRLHGTFIPNYFNASGSAICIHKNLLPEGAIVTHVVTCQGRDHTVTIHSGDCVLVVVNVHFEPELTLRSLRERLRLITPRWPHCPDALGVFAGDQNFANQKKEDSMFGTRLSPTVTRGRLPFFHSFSSRSRNCPA